MRILPTAMYFLIHILSAAVLSVDGQQSDACSAAEVLTDTCIFRLDNECDNESGIPFCDAGTDCYDCDPCLAFANDCVTCTAQSYCGWCSMGTTGKSFCLSLGFTEALPDLCSTYGGTDWNIGSCSAVPPTSPVVAPPPSVTAPASSPSVGTTPTNNNEIGSYSCNYAVDTCRFVNDDMCDAGTVFCPDDNSDCFDCDPCQALRFDGCEACTKAGCVWCGTDAICLSSASNVILPTTSSCAVGDFVSTCTAMENVDDDTFNDPLRESQSWAFDQINLKAAWDLGYTGKGVGIRFNDDGVDNLHPEFAGRFVTESSCTISRPVSLEEKHGHGTSVASLAVGSGTDGSCGVGVAPGASLSACRVVLTDIGEDLALEADDESYLYLKMDGMDISQNSYGSRVCFSLDGSDDVRRRRRFRKFRRLQSATTCPFGSPTVCDTCSAVDWTNPQPNVVCKRTITLYCTDKLRYQVDAAACSEFLDLLVTCDYVAIDEQTSLALERGIQRGRDGKGIIYVFASGNDYFKGVDTNFVGTLVSRYTIPVGATGRDGLQALYSTGGTALFVSAPGGDLDNYASNFGAASGGGCRGIGAGTSFSSPIVSGVIALMLEANPELTWRDVKGILASTSRRLDANDKSWIVNGAGLHHSYLYGFGVVDAGAAVIAAKSWQLYSAERQITADSGMVELAIPDFPGDAVTSAVTVTDTDFIVESVNVYLDLVHASRGHLEIVLISPNGTESLLNPGPRPENNQLEEPWKLLTVRSWGEKADGVWSVRLIDRKAGNVADCVDSSGWVLDLLGSDLDCDLFERAQICSNGGEGAEFADLSTSSLTDPVLANADGITPGEACCACGGGVAAASVKNVLQSWQLVLYGRIIGDTTSGKASPSPITTVPGPSPQLTVPVFPTAVQPNNNSNNKPVTSSATLPTTTSTVPSAPSLNSNGLVSGGSIINNRPKCWYSCCDLSMLLVFLAVIHRCAVGL